MKRKVFIAWSGERSKQVAESLFAWLNKVFRELIPFCSTVSIQAGERWRDRLSREFKGADLGVLCLTPENIGSTWLLFEAGALAAASRYKIVIPYILQSTKVNLPGPLDTFQAALADREGTRGLVETIAQKTGAEVTAMLRKCDRLWPELHERLMAIQSSQMELLNPVVHGIPVVSAFRELDYAKMLREFDAYREGDLLVYNAEFNTFTSSQVFGTVWGDFHKLPRIRKAIFLSSQDKARVLAVMLKPLLWDPATLPILDKFIIREYVETPSHRRDGLDRVSFAIFRTDVSDARPPIYPRAAVWILSSPFSSRIVSPFVEGVRCWKCEYALSVDVSWDPIERLDAIWRRQVGNAGPEMTVQDLVAKYASAEGSYGERNGATQGIAARRSSKGKPSARKRRQQGA